MSVLRSRRSRKWSAPELLLPQLEGDLARSASLDLHLLGHLPQGLVPHLDLVLAGCDVHSWMSGWLVVQAHPHYAVSDAQGVTLNDIIPVNTTFVSFASPAGWINTMPAVGGTGTVTRGPDLVAYQAGTSVELTAVPADNYQFVEWSGDLTGNANPATLLMDCPPSTSKCSPHLMRVFTPSNAKVYATA